MNAIEQIRRTLTTVVPTRSSLEPPIGERYGKLVVLGEAPRGLPDSRGYKARRWLCRCDCGVTKPMRIANIRARIDRGIMLSCGCSAGLTGRFTTEKNPNARRS